MLAWLASVRKAIVAAATPIVLEIANQVFDILESQLPVLATAVVTAAVVYLAPNRQSPAQADD